MIILLSILYLTTQNHLHVRIGNMKTCSLHMTSIVDWHDDISKKHRYNNDKRSLIIIIIEIEDWMSEKT